MLSRRGFITAGAVTLAGLAGVAVPARKADSVAMPTDGMMSLVGAYGRLSGVHNVKDPVYGAKGDGAKDDTAALKAAIATAAEIIYLPPGQYRITGTLTLGKGQTLRGAGPDSTILLVDFAGVAVTLNDQFATLEHVGMWASAAFVGQYTGIKVIAAGQMSRTVFCNIYNAAIGMWFQGGVYYHQTHDVYIYLARNYGVKMEPAVANGPTPSNNFLSFRHIVGYNKTAGSYGIYCWGGTNTFRGGEVNDFDAGFYLKGPENRLEGIYEELCNKTAHVESGIQYCDSHMSSGLVTWGDDTAMVSGPWGDVRIWGDFLRSRQSSDKLKLLLHLDEAAGTKVIDHSGSNKHADLTGAGYTRQVAGIFGPCTKIDYTTGSILKLPVTGAVDFTQPFTVMALINPETYAPASAGTFFWLRDNASKYIGVDIDDQGSTVRSWDGAVGQALGLNMRGYRNGSWGWIVVGFDPVAGKVYNLDPVRRPNGDAESVNLTFPYTAGSLAGGACWIGSRDNTDLTHGFKGSVANVMVFQSLLTHNQVWEIVNNRSRPNNPRVRIGQELFLVSANGTTYKVTVSDAGAVTTTAV